MTPSFVIPTSAASKAVLAAVNAAESAQTAVATLSASVSDATAAPRLWDFLNLAGGIPIYVGGVGDNPNIPAWAKQVPATTKYAVMDIEAVAMDPGSGSSVYSGGGAGVVDITKMQTCVKAARADLPVGTKIGTTCILPSWPTFNADYSYGGASNIQRVYEAMPACFPAYAGLDFIAAECYLSAGQGPTFKDYFAQVGQWLGIPARYGLPVMAVIQPLFSDNAQPIPGDLFGMAVRYLASICGYGVCLWGNPAPQYRAAYLASPAVAWLKGRVASDGTLNLN